MENENVEKRKPKSPAEANLLAKEHKNQQQKKQEGVVKTTKPSNTDSGPGRPPRISNEQKVRNEMKSQQKPDRPALQKRPLSVPQDVSTNINYLFRIFCFNFPLIAFLGLLEIQVYRRLET